MSVLTSSPRLTLHCLLYTHQLGQVLQVGARPVEVALAGGLVEPGGVVVGVGGAALAVARLVPPLLGEQLLVVQPAALAL